MEVLFFISDFFLWFLVIVLFVWIIILSHNVSHSEKTIRILTEKLNDLYYRIMQGKPINDLQNAVREQQVSEKPQVKVQEPVVPVQQPTVQVQRPEATVNPSVNVNTARTVNNTVKSKNSMETFFLGNIFNKIGALALIIALIIFIKLVSNYIIFTDVMKITLGFCSGLGLFLGGLKLHSNEKMKNYSEVLIGTGFASLFITTYCSHFLKVLSAPAAMGTGVVILLTVFFVAHRMKTMSALVIGLIGGYLTPNLTGASHDASFCYLIFLNLVSLIYTLNNVKAKWINPINLFLTMSILLITCIGLDVTKVVYPMVLWGIYIVYDLIRDKSSAVDNATCLFNYIFLILTTMLMFKSSAKEVGMLLGLTAVVYAVLAYFGKRVGNPLYKRYEHCIFLNVWFSVLFTLSDLYSIIMWSVIALMLSFAVKRDKLNSVKHYITFYYLSAIFGVFLAKDGSTYILVENYRPIFNLRTLIFLIPSLSMLMSVSRLRVKEYHICNLLRFGIISLTYVYVMSEIIGLINQHQVMLNELSDVGYLKLTVYVIVGFLYSIFLNNVSKNTKFILFDIIGHLLGITSLLMLVGSELAHPTYLLPVFNLRLLAYGAGLYYCCYYARETRQELFRYLSVVIGFVLCSAEGLNFDHIFNTGYMASLSWLLYSGSITLAGIVKKQKYLINSGIWILILSILRVFIYDLASVEPIYKIIAFLALGVILMIISYIYVRQKSE